MFKYIHHCSISSSGKITIKILTYRQETEQIMINSWSGILYRHWKLKLSKQRINKKILSVVVAQCKNIIQFCKTKTTTKFPICAGKVVGENMSNTTTVFSR